MKRRDFLKLAGAASLAGCASPAPSKARVVVLGGGFGGATAAKYIRMWDPSIDVVLVQRYGVKLVRDEVTAIDPGRRSVRLARGGDIAYERLIVSPGIDFMFGELP